MRYVKIFEEFSGMKRSEADRLNAVPGSRFFRATSWDGSSYLRGHMDSAPMERFEIRKKDGEISVRIDRDPGYFGGVPMGHEGWQEDWAGRDWSIEKSFPDAESAADFLSSYNKK